MIERKFKAIPISIYVEEIERGFYKLASELERVMNREHFRQEILRNVFILPTRIKSFSMEVGFKRFLWCIDNLSITDEALENLKTDRYDWVKEYDKLTFDVYILNKSTEKDEDIKYAIINAIDKYLKKIGCGKKRSDTQKIDNNKYMIMLKTLKELDIYLKVDLDAIRPGFEDDKYMCVSLVAEVKEN